MYLLIIAIFIVLALSDFPKLIRERCWKAIIILSCFYAAVLTMAVLMSVGVTLPSPFVGIQTFITDVLNLGYPKP